MNIVLVVFAFVVVVTGVIVTQKTIQSGDENIPSSSAALFDKSDESKVNGENESDNILKPSTIPSPDNPITENTSLQETIDKKDNYADYIYPNSEVLSSSEGNILLKSSDDSSVITDWYKDIIKKKDMNINTFVQTNTNDKVLNKLVGSGNGLEIRIDISKEPSSLPTQIEVSIITNSGN